MLANVYARRMELPSKTKGKSQNYLVSVIPISYLYVLGWGRDKVGTDCAVSGVWTSAQSQFRESVMCFSLPF